MHIEQAGDSAGGMLATARTALRTTCAEWSSRRDQELFKGRRSTFLRLCPLLNPLQFERFFEGFMFGVNGTKFGKDEKIYKTLKESVEGAVRGVVEGAHETKNTCWECKTREHALFRCAKCHVAIYCSRQCQESAWNGGTQEEMQTLLR